MKLLDFQVVECDRLRDFISWYSKRAYAENPSTAFPRYLTVEEWRRRYQLWINQGCPAP